MQNVILMLEDIKANGFPNFQNTEFEEKKLKSQEKFEEELKVNFEEKQKDSSFESDDRKLDLKLTTDFWFSSIKNLEMDVIANIIAYTLNVKKFI